MKKTRLAGNICAAIGLLLACSVTQANSIAIDPVTDSAPANGTINYSFAGSNFETLGGAFDLSWDASVLTYNGDFAFDAGLTPRDAFFDIIDFQAPGLLSIGWNAGFGSSIIFGAIPKAIGSLSFTMKSTTNPGDFSALTMVDSVNWGGFTDAIGSPLAINYVGGMATNPVPVPAAVWLFGSGLLGLVGMARRKQTA